MVHWTAAGLVIKLGSGCSAHVVVDHSCSADGLANPTAINQLAAGLDSASMGVSGAAY